MITSEIRTPGEKAKINAFLKRNGLSTLDDPNLAKDLAFLVKGHDHIQSLLLRLAPDLRQQMYEAMAPHLRFRPMPLDRYVARAAEAAEAYETASERESRAIGEATQKATAPISIIGVMELTCHLCERGAIARGNTTLDCQLQLLGDGWKIDVGLDDKKRATCPKCNGKARKAQ